MFFLPGYVDYYEKDNAVFVRSELHQNVVKISENNLVNEFYSIVNDAGCEKLSTPLKSFLHEQGLLVNENEIRAEIDDVYDIIKSTLMMTIMPTDGCNFRCSYCYEDHKTQTMSQAVHDEIKRYISESVPFFRHVSIGWFGGEPTLCKNIIMDTSRLIRRLQSEYTFKYTASMTTNGYLLGVEDFKDYYHLGITSYQITLDGWDHDKMRPLASGQGTLKNILNNLVEISKLPTEKYSYQIILRHNILAGDVEYDWYDYLKQLLGEDKRFSILIRPVYDWGGELVQSLKLLKGKQMSSLIESHISYVESIGMTCENTKKGILSGICYASYPHGMVFRADGKIEKCTLCLDHPKNCIGYVKPDVGISIDESANSSWTTLAMDEKCYHCQDILTCLSMSCKMPKIVEGQMLPNCPRAILSA